MFKVKIMNKVQYPFLLEIIMLPVTWTIMVFKILITIPNMVTAYCNTLADKIEVR